MWLEAIAIACLLAVCVVVGAGGNKSAEFTAPEQVANDREYWG